MKKLLLAAILLCGLATPAMAQRGEGRRDTDQRGEGRRDMDQRRPGAPVAAQAWERGMRVLVYVNGDGYWYPATVSRVRGNLVTATYLSSNGRVSVPSNLVAPLDWRRGPYEGNVIDVVYDDGTRHRSNLRYCRTGRGL
jgi:hypothetical protein